MIFSILIYLPVDFRLPLLISTAERRTKKFARSVDYCTTFFRFCQYIFSIFRGVGEPFLQKVSPR